MTPPAPPPENCPAAPVNGAENGQQHWTVDRRIPVAFLLALLAQTVGGVWWAATITESVRSMSMEHDKRLTRLEAVRESDRVGERLATLEVQMTDVRSAVLRIDDRTREAAVARRGVGKE